jgi:hypothetical protein
VQFAVDAGRAREQIGQAHLTYQITDFRYSSWAAPDGVIATASMSESLCDAFGPRPAALPTPSRWGPAAKPGEVGPRTRAKSDLGAVAAGHSPYVAARVSSSSKEARRRSRKPSMETTVERIVIMPATVRR